MCLALIPGEELQNAKYRDGNDRLTFTKEVRKSSFETQTLWVEE